MPEKSLNSLQVDKPLPNSLVPCSLFLNLATIYSRTEIIKIVVSKKPAKFMLNGPQFCFDDTSTQKDYSPQKRE